MFNELRFRAARMARKYPEGTVVSLSWIEGVLDGALGVVEFVDDIGNVFVETGEGFKNVVLTPADEGVRFVKVDG